MTVAISVPAVEVAGLRKSFGRTVALHGIDLHVAAGTIFALLGPNGAGKSPRREAQHLHLATVEFAGVLEPGASSFATASVAD